MLKSKFKYIALLMFTFYSMSMLSQDSIVQDSSKTKKFKLYFAFDARRSFVIQQKVKFNGFKLGFEYKEKHRFGITFHQLAQPVMFIGNVDKTQYQDATDTLFFNFNYASLFYERIWFRNKRWQITSPVNFGVGALEIRYRDTSGINSSPFINGGSLVGAIGVTTQFKVFRWFALGTGFGYRTMLTRDKNIKKPLNAPFYQFQVKIFIGELYRMAFKKDELEPW